MPRIAANLVLLLTAFIWGATFVAQATAMEKIGPVTFSGLRSVIALAALVPLVLAEKSRGSHGRIRDHAALIVSIAAAYTAGQVTQQIGITGTSVTNTGFLTALYVIFTPFIAIAFFREWPHRVVWPAALVAILGTYLLGGGLGRLGTSDAIVILGAVFWAIHLVLLGRAMRATGRPFTIVFVQSLVSAIVATPIGMALESPEIAAILSAWPELLFAGVLSGAIAYSLQAIGQRHTGEGEAAVILSSEAVFAALAGAILLGERLDAAGLLGGALILAAVLAVQLAPLRAAGRRITLHHT